VLLIVVFDVLIGEIYYN